MKANETLVKTPEEAIKTIKSNMPTSGYQILREALDMAITALKEIQQYREVDAQIKKIFDGQLGLVDIVKEYIEDIRRTHNGKMPRKVIALSEEDAQNWEDYKEIGTVEECRKAVEKQKPKKPKLNYKPKFFGKATYTCPKCGNVCLKKFANERQNNNYCWDCGQAINWGENLEGNVDEKN